MTPIKSIQELRANYRKPSARAANKAIFSLDKHAREFIELSSYFVLSSVDDQGFIDISPRGGEPGFVKVLNDKEFMFSDAKGNNRLDTFENVIARPKIGIMFFVQSVDETLRVKGQISLIEDPASLELIRSPKGKPSIVAKVDVTELFFHCGKAAMRSGLWDAKYKIERSGFANISQIMKDQQDLKEDALSQEEVMAHYKQTL